MSLAGTGFRVSVTIALGTEYADVKIILVGCPTCQMQFGFVMVSLTILSKFQGVSKSIPQPNCPNEVAAISASEIESRSFSFKYYDLR